MNLELRSTDEIDTTLFSDLIKKCKEKYINEFFFFVVSKEVTKKLIDIGSYGDEEIDYESSMKYDYLSSQMLKTDLYYCIKFLGINVLVNKKLEGLTIKTYTTILKEV